MENIVDYIIAIFEFYAGGLLFYVAHGQYTETNKVDFAIVVCILVGVLAYVEMFSTISYLI